MKRIVTNPEYENAHYEMALSDQSGKINQIKFPFRFKSRDDYSKFLKTGDLKYTIPPTVEVES